MRSGKSYVDIAHVIPNALIQRREEKGLNLILGVSKGTIERNVLQPMREIFGGRLIGQINSRNIAVVCGCPVYCLGAEKVNQVSKIVGSSVKYCYGDEIAKWSPDVFEQIKARLDRPGSRFDGACNPEYPSHWLKQFIDRDDIDKYVQKYTIDDNPFLPPEFVENLKREYSGTVFYQRYILGEWALAEGLIYPMAGEAVAEPPEGEPLKYALSIDYGTENAFAALIWEYHSDGVWYAVDEYYYSGRETGVTKTDEEYGQDIDAFTERIPDAKIKTVVDPSAASFIALLQRKKRYGVIQADNAVLDGIRDTATAMQTGRIKVSPRLKNWRKEADGYAWDDSTGEDRPIKVNDHLMDSMRYFVRTFQIMAKKKREVNAIENISGLGYSWR